jgi:hypothetical protein
MTLIKVYMNSNGKHYNYNKDFIPLVIFKYKNVYFSLDYDSYSNKSKLVENTGIAVHNFKAFSSKMNYLKGDFNKLDDKHLLKAFKQGDISVFGILMINNKDKGKSLFPEDFSVNTRKNFGVHVIVDNKDYANIRLDKKFKIM